MALVKFNCKGRFSDNGKAGMPQFDHDVDEVVEVSAQCAQEAVEYGMAKHVKRKSEKNPAEEDKKKAEKNEELDKLRAEAESLGMTGYKRLGVDKLRAKIEAHKSSSGE